MALSAMFFFSPLFFNHPLSLLMDSHIAELHSASGSGKLLETDLQCARCGTLPLVHRSCFYQHALVSPE